MTIPLSNFHCINSNNGQLRDNTFKFTYRRSPSSQDFVASNTRISNLSIWFEYVDNNYAFLICFFFSNFYLFIYFSFEEAWAVFGSDLVFETVSFLASPALRLWAIHECYNFISASSSIIVPIIVLDTEKISFALFWIIITLKISIGATINFPKICCLLFPFSFLVRS